MTNHKRRFCLVLIKPSHYDDDGYLIQWLRSGTMEMFQSVGAQAFVGRIQRVGKLRRGAVV